MGNASNKNRPNENAHNDSVLKQEGMKKSTLVHSSTDPGTFCTESMCSTTMS